MKSNHRVIITDIDGVMLDWEAGFHNWMADRGHELQIQPEDFGWDIGERFLISEQEGRRMIQIFNQSAIIGYLPAFRDAQHYASRLVAEGYKFVAITSLGTEPYAVKLRKKNLADVFGDDAFLDVHCLPLAAGKRTELEHYAEIYPGAVWIEDKPENALLGMELGYHTILMQHPHNTEYADQVHFCAQNWRDIHEYITSL